MPRTRHTAETYIAGIREGDRVMLSQAITLVESARPADRELSNEIIRTLLPETGNSYRVGITGVPGVGKSTFIDAFGTLLCDAGKQVAVLAIDPSSNRTKGSILGDKTRMERLSMNPAAYVRPSPTGGSLGGVARKTRESLLLCEAAGYDIILVETVGVGQSETAVHDMVDMFLLLMLANAGDELQGIKKGIMEMVDMVLINKADGNFAQKARAAKAVYAQALRLFPLQPSGWRPPVMTCSALHNLGLEDIWEKMEAYRDQMQEGPYWQQRRSNQALTWMHDTIRHQLEDMFFSHPEVSKTQAQLETEIGELKISPIQAAEKLLEVWQSAKG
ncbi:MAG: methylmalonyl Co-A mutase-associated GTPase MeaB [Bacteroidota bacterium]